MNGHLRSTVSRLFGLDRPTFLNEYLARSFPLARVSSVIFAIHGTMWNAFGIPTPLTHLSVVALITRYVPPIIFIIFTKWSRHHYHWIVCATFLLFLSTTITYQLFGIHPAEFFGLTFIAAKQYNLSDILYAYLISVFYLLLLTRIPFLHAFVLTITSFAYLVTAVSYSHGLWHLSNDNLYRHSSLFVVVTLALYVNYWLQARERALYEEKIKTRTTEMVLKTKNRELDEMNDDKSRLIAQLQDAKGQLEAKNHELEKINNEKNGLITSLQKTKTELETKNNELGQMNNDKVELMWRAGHNIRGGLLPIRSKLRDVNSNLEKRPVDTEPIRKQINEALSGLSMSIDILDRLMGVNQYQTGKIIPEMKLVDVRELVTQIHEQFHETADEKHIFFSYYKGRTPLVAYTDKDAIIECITNLVNNAIKYTNHKNDSKPANPPDLHDQRIKNSKIKSRPSSGVIIGVIPYRDLIRIHVVDTGIGIPEQDADNIWRPFFRVEKKHTPESVGLGLYTVNRIVSALAAQLSDHHIALCWSREGIGSHFAIDIPRTLLPAELIAAAANGKPDHIIDGAYVLLIGKPGHDLLEMAQMIEVWKGRVVYGPDASSVLDKISENQRVPDAIIFNFDNDCETPADAIDEIRHKFCITIPALVVTSNHEYFQDINRYFHIEKPFSHSDFIEKLHEVLTAG